MKKNYILSILTVAMLLPFTAVKAQFDAGDSTVCYNIMTNNFSAANMLNWNDPNPANWLAVEWNTATPKRIIRLSLDQDGVLSGKAFYDGLGAGDIPQEDGFVDIGGVDAELTGVLDLSALAELKFLDLRNQGLVTSLNLTGLNNLEHFIVNKTNALITSYDFSNMANLQYVSMSYGTNTITSIDASNCPRLKSIKTKSDGLISLNITGSDSLIGLSLNDANLVSLDVTTKTQLRHLKMKNSDSLTTLVGVNNCDSLIHIAFRRSNNLVAEFDFVDYNTANFLGFDVRETKVRSANSWDLLGPGIQKMRFSDASLTLSNATQIANELTVGSLDFDFDNQTRHGGDTIYTGGATSYPGEDLIDINGTDVASTFTLFDFTGTQVGATNATGVFTFPTTLDTGIYYVEMTNPGAAPAFNSVLLTTNNFAVRCQGGADSQTLTICAGDSVVVGSSTYKTTGTFVEPFLMVDGCDSLHTTILTVLAPIDTSVATSNETMTSNESGATYQWIDCGNGNVNIAGATGASYTATVNGSYAVEVTVGSCSETSACVTISTVGINELDAGNTVSVYPNPMNEVVTIELENAVKNTQVTVVNVEGKVVYSEIVNTAKVSVDGADWNNGIYIVKITNVEYTKTLKLIK